MILAIRMSILVKRKKIKVISILKQMNKLCQIYKIVKTKMIKIKMKKNLKSYSLKLNLMLLKFKIEMMTLVLKKRILKVSTIRKLKMTSTQNLKRKAKKIVNKKLMTKQMRFQPYCKMNNMKFYLILVTKNLNLVLKK